jgi:hypothetical protein
MAHVDRIADKPRFLSSFFSEAARTGLFEAVIVSLGGLAISFFIIAAVYMPFGMELPGAP